MDNEPLSKEWQSPWLLQRLQKPWKEEASKMQLLADSLSFGGGLVRGGFTKEAMDMLRKVCRFDYMGSSEFEWGAVPNAFYWVFERHDEFKTGEMEVTCTGTDYEAGKKKRKHVEKTVTAKIYYICLPDHEDKWKEFINKCAAHKEELKEISMLSYNLINESSSRSCGWIELGMGYMFFTDKKMFDDMCGLFEIGESREKAEPVSEKTEGSV